MAKDWNNHQQNSTPLRKSPTNRFWFQMVNLTTRPYKRCPPQTGLTKSQFSWLHFAFCVQNQLICWVKQNHMSMWQWTHLYLISVTLKAKCTRINKNLTLTTGFKIYSSSHLMLIILNPNQTLWQPHIIVYKPHKTYKKSSCCTILCITELVG